MPDYVFAMATAIAFASSQASKPQIKVGGYLDGYHQYSFDRPANGDSLNGRGLDIAHNRPTLSFAELDISMDPKPFGFNLQLYGGRGPELIHLAEPGGRNKYRWVRQAYGSYSGKNVNIELGKFDTWIGCEGIDNRFQDEYSRSFNWTYSEPVYETGVRASTKLMPKLNGTLSIVQGWNEVEDGNGGKSVGIALAYSPDDKTTLTLQNHFGDEGSNQANDVGSFGGIGFANAGVSRVHLIDFIASRQITPATKIAFNVDYANSEKAPNNGKWNGEVLYVRHQLRPNQSVGFRFDRFEDTNAVRTGTVMQLYSLTGTFDYTFTDHLTMRFEVRHDLASQPFFNSDSGPRRSRTTLTAAGVVKF